MTSYTCRVPRHSSPLDGRRGKVGFQWAVYHQHSSHGTSGILANGITDKPAKAKTVVEMILAQVDEAAWGILVRVVLDLGSAYHVEEPLGDWPPAGEVQYCRRATNGDFTWDSLYPRDNVLPKGTSR